jgi:tetratricopeptide (TPR) repeat protein
MSNTRILVTYTRPILAGMLLVGLSSPAFVGCGKSATSPRPSEAAPAPAADPAADTAAGTDLKWDDVVLTSGAAPGYVSDHVCAECHSELFESYQHVGMANSFFRPSAERVIEDFENNRFFHLASQRHYEMVHRDGEYIFKRYEVDADGKPINVYRRKVDWIMGSGNHSRVYLYQTEEGEIYQLPVTWYTQEKSWGMAPSYDRADHEGITRLVRRECMFCHNAYPDAPAGSDAYAMAQVYPQKLPEGIGCQRCHGPGGAHVRAALAEEPDDEKVYDTIVNPAGLERQLAADVCNSCHLQSTVALFGVRRFGRADYSFKPGEAQGDYLVQMDISEADLDRSERFEINHHPYRLHQSVCFQESDGALRCTTCHDPHRKVAPDERIAHYRQACLTCHQDDDCSVDEPTVEHLSVARDNCIDCHMPKRRTQDVIHVAMTDHFIGRRPGGSELLVPLAEKKHTVSEVELLDPQTVPDEKLADVYRTLAVLRAASFRHAPATDHLTQLLADDSVQHYEPYVDLAEAQLKLRRFTEAEQSVKKALALKEDLGHVQAWLGLALAAQGKTDEAIEQYQTVLESESRPEARYNLGLLLFGRKEYDRAAEQLEQAVASRPNMIMAWFYLGQVHLELDRIEEAAGCFQRALEIQPNSKRVYQAIYRSLTALGKSSEAFRYHRHANRFRAGARPDTGGTAAPSGAPELLPVPAPDLAGLEPAVAEEIKSLQRYFAGAIAKVDSTANDFLDVFSTLGQVYHAYGLMEPAERCYLNASRVAAGDFRWRHLLGVVCVEQDKLPTAVDHFKAAHELAPEFETTAIRLGNIHLQLKQWDDARQAFEAASKANDKSAAAASGLGQVALAEGEYADAVKHLQRALEFAPEANRIHEALAAAYSELGETEKANEHLQKKGTVGIVVSDPLVDRLRERFLGDELFLLRGFRHFSAGRFDEAADAFSAAVEAKPNSPRTHVNLGTTLARTGDVDGAIAHHEKAVQLEPENRSARFSLGVLFTSTQEFEDALKHLRFLIDANPDDAPVVRQLARTLLAAGQADESLEAYRRLPEVWPGDQEGLLELTALLDKREHFSEAIELLTQAEEKHPGRPETRHALARLLAGCPDASLRDGERAVDLAEKAYNATERPEHAETLAMALAEAGRCDEAVVIQKKLITKAKRIRNEEIEQRLTEALRRYEKGPPCGPPSQDTPPEKPPEQPPPGEEPAPDSVLKKKTVAPERP